MKMNTIDDMRIQAEIYSELLNDMQAQIYEFKTEHPECMTNEIKKIDQQLSAARMESRIFIDEEHFQKWEDLLCFAKAAMAQSLIFR